MNNPEIVKCTKDVWTKVVTEKVTGNLGKSDDTVIYFYTYKKTGESAPLKEVRGLYWESLILSISATESIDVYIKPIGRDGAVEVMA